VDGCWAGGGSIVADTSGSSSAGLLTSGTGGFVLISEIVGASTFEECFDVDADGWEGAVAVVPIFELGGMGRSFESLADLRVGTAASDLRLEPSLQRDFFSLGGVVIAASDIL